MLVARRRRATRHRMMPFDIFVVFDLEVVVVVVRRRRRRRERERVTRSKAVLLKTMTNRVA